MGNPLSSILAELVMEDFENKTIATSPTPLRAWKRYVDDTFTIVKKGQQDTVLRHLNAQNADIQFTMEIQSNNQLPFLDVLLEVRADHSIRTSVYRKPTDTAHTYHQHHVILKTRNSVQHARYFDER